MTGNSLAFRSKTRNEMSSQVSFSSKQSTHVPRIGSAAKQNKMWDQECSGVAHESKAWKGIVTNTIRRSRALYSQVSGRNLVRRNTKSEDTCSSENSEGAPDTKSSRDSKTDIGFSSPRRKSSSKKAKTIQIIASLSASDHTSVTESSFSSTVRSPRPRLVRLQSSPLLVNKRSSTFSPTAHKFNVSLSPIASSNGSTDEHLASPQRLVSPRTRLMRRQSSPSLIRRRSNKSLEESLHEYETIVSEKRAPQIAKATERVSRPPFSRLQSSLHLGYKRPSILVKEYEDIVRN